MPVPSSGSNRLISSLGSSVGSLDDRLTAESGTFFFPGLVMLVRLILDQQRRDQDDGRRIRGSLPATLARRSPDLTFSCSAPRNYSRRSGSSTSPPRPKSGRWALSWGPRCSTVSRTASVTG